MKILTFFLLVAGCGTTSDCPTLTPPASQPLMCHSADMLSWCASERGCTMRLEYQTTSGEVRACQSLATVVVVDAATSRTELHYDSRGALIGGAREVKGGVGYVYTLSRKIACSTSLETGSGIVH